MNENAKKWIAALRSGKYKQTAQRLRDSDGFCCLGVACDVYRKETRKGKWANRANGDLVTGKVYYGFATKSADDCVTSLPNEVREWLGMEDECGEFKNYAIVEGKVQIPELSLAGWNDSGAADFKRIADIIESEPKGMFFKDE